MFYEQTLKEKSWREVQIYLASMWNVSKNKEQEEVQKSTKKLVMLPILYCYESCTVIYTSGLL